MAEFMVTPGTIAKGVETEITLEGDDMSLIAGTSEIKIVASGDNCAGGSISKGGRRWLEGTTGDGSGKATFTLGVDSTDAKVCYKESGGTEFVDTEKTINSASKAEAQMSGRSH